MKKIIPSIVLMLIWFTTILAIAYIEKNEASDISVFIAQPLVIDVSCDYRDSGIECFCLKEQSTNEDCLFNIERALATAYLEFYIKAHKVLDTSDLNKLYTIGVLENEKY